MNKYRVRPGQKVDLHHYDPADTALISGKAEAVERSSGLRSRLEQLQGILFAEHRRKLLVVLQGMDTSGKDGTIRHVMGGLNPQGTRVVSFRAPSPEELDHDYLWRVHQNVPGKGEIVVFNRSHYEDVLIVRVHGLVPTSVLKRRFEHIRTFEQMLHDEGTVILKFFLHISRDEQRKRLQERIDDPTKRWKFQHGDLEERKLWPDYQRAYEEALSRTSTEESPWYIIPANRKWYRNYLVASILTETLESLDMKYPEVDLTGVEIE